MDTYSQQVGYTVPEIVTGKPIVLGGSKGREEATGRGLVYLIQEAALHIGIDLKNATAVIQGFGNVGRNAATFLEQLGVKIIGISNVSCGLYSEKGLALSAIDDHLQKNGTLVGYEDASQISNNELLELECDILAPCALQNQITDQNAPYLKCKMLAEGANGPTSLEADKILWDRGIFVLPDILGNAGGVTVSYFEWVQNTQEFAWTLEVVNERLHHIMVEAFQRTLMRSQRDNVDMRTAALLEGIARVAEAKLLRGVFP